MTADLSCTASQEEVPLVIFAHGFQGFKDWGPWPLAAEIFASKGFPFLKFNFSHNGTSTSDYSDIHDLEAFGSNNFEIETSSSHT